MTCKIGTLHRMIIGLRLALLGKVVLPLIGVFALTIYFALAALQQATEQRLQEDIKLVARAIRLPVSTGLEQGTLNTLEDSLNSVLEIGRVYGAYVFDQNGDQVAAVGSVEPGRRDERKAAEIAAVGEQIGEYRRIEGRDVYSYFLPLFDTGGRINGLLQVTREQRDFTRKFDELRQQAALIMLGGTLLVLAIVLLGHDRAIGRHVRALLGSMHRVETGDQAHRAHPQGPREIRNLASALNTMLDGIEHNERELAEQRQAQAALTERLRETEKMAALGRMASGVAHELGAPLSVIDGRARQLQKTADGAGKTRENLAQIRNQVRRMAGFIRQLLEFARASTRTPRWIHATDLVHSSVQAMRNEYESTSACLQVQPPPTGLQLRGDPIRLEQALTNLLRNALQASPDGPVILHSQPCDQGLALMVDDSGPGIDPELAAQLFEPFVTSKAQGTGLGLSIAHSVALEHGGHLQTDTSPQGGARFILWLPSASGHSDD